jgi:putative DNA primase/helicase
MTDIRRTGPAVVPPDVRDVTVAADPDEPGQRAAWAAARRRRAEGRRVRVAAPDDPAADFDDLIARRAAAVGVARG